MWDPTIDGAIPHFWRPRPSTFWSFVLNPLRLHYLRRHYGVTEIAIDGAEGFRQRFAPADGVLFAPNHSHDSDPHVMMEVGHRLGIQPYFMAAWQLFRGHWGIDGWILQRMGAFSVDREGCDRRAIRQAVDLLTGGKFLVVFPEGEVYHLNERLTPLLEGVAFMALTAQRELEKGPTGATVWIVPTAIQYRYLEDIRQALGASMDKLESRMLLKSKAETSLQERIVRFGEVLLTIKEKEYLGRSRESEGDLPTRIARFIDILVERLESQHLKKVPSADTMPLRIKSLRRHLLQVFADETADAAARRKAREDLDDVHLALQLYSYPGDYVSRKPTVERMAETVEKFEEDIHGWSRPKGKRRARVILGEPIDLKDGSSGRGRAAAANATARLERAIQDLMSA